MAVRFNGDTTLVKSSALSRLDTVQSAGRGQSASRGGATHLYSCVHPDQHAALINSASIGVTCDAPTQHLIHKATAKYRY
jgi:hypothetical protein